MKTTLALVAALSLAIPLVAADPGDQAPSECLNNECMHSFNDVSVTGLKWEGYTGWFHPEYEAGSQPTSNARSGCTGLLGLNLRFGGDGLSRLFAYHPQTVVEGDNSDIPTSVEDPNVNFYFDDDGNLQRAGCVPATAPEDTGYGIGLHPDGVVTWGLTVDHSTSTPDTTATASRAWQHFACDPDAIDAGHVPSGYGSPVIGEMFYTSIDVDGSKCEYTGDFFDLLGNTGSTSFDSLLSNQFTPDEGAGSWSGLMVTCVTVTMHIDGDPLNTFDVVAHDWYWLAGVNDDSSRRDQAIAIGSDPSNWGNEWDLKYDNGCPSGLADAAGWI